MANNVTPLPGTTEIDYLIIRINRDWLTRVRTKVQSAIAILLICGGGTTWASIQSLVELWHTQDTAEQTQVVAEEANQSAKSAAESAEMADVRSESSLDLQLDEVEERCKTLGYTKPKKSGPPEGTGE